LARITNSIQGRDFLMLTLSKEEMK